MPTPDWPDVCRQLEQQNPSIIRYELGAMERAVHHEGVSRPAPRVAIVAGTNGKGTICSFLNAFSVAAGWHVGLYTSPHLVSFRERVRLDGQPIDANEAAALAHELLVRHGAQAPRPPAGRPLSYFELGTLMALRAFASRPLDLAILEVGLGGRLDATNVVDADVAAFGSIALDHVDWLGADLRGIAGEKAAVARPGRHAIHHARLGGATLLAEALDTIGAVRTTVTEGLTPRDRNRAVAEAAFRTLCRDALPEERISAAIEEGGRRVLWPGRQQLLERAGARWWIDGAHNAESVDAARGWLRDALGGRRVPAIVGLSPGRAAPDVLGPIAELVSSWHVTASRTGRARPADDVAHELLPGGPPVHTHAAPGAAVSALADEPDVIVLGSLYLVGDVLAALGYDESNPPPILIGS